MGYKTQLTKSMTWTREQYETLKRQQEEARERYEEAVGKSDALRESVLGRYDELSDQDKIDFQRSMEAEAASGRQQLAARGLAGSSIASTAEAGSRRETAYGLARMSDERLRQRIGLETGLTASHINLLQAGPTAPSTAFFQATVANLSAAQNYALQKQRMAYEQAGVNKSWGAWLAGGMAPGAIEERGYAIGSWLGGPEFRPSDPYYRGGYGGTQPSAGQPPAGQPPMGQSPGGQAGYPAGGGGYGTSGGGTVPPAMGMGESGFPITSYPLFV